VQKTQRFVADQRLDLPLWDSAFNFIADEFRFYYKSFLTDKTYIVQNWKVEDNGGLDIKINKAVDSLLYNTEDTNAKQNYRDTTKTLLTATLADNATNYVELEIVPTTTGTDLVALWDQSANSGDGEEFIQSSDTVLCEEPTIVTNTIQFTPANPARIPLAIVTTSGGAITNIQDSREFLFHLASDWDFDGSSFGLTRTDKTIKNLKNMYDAITTSLKELKDTTNWYDDPGISTIDLLERMNYLLVDGGNISWNLPKAATGFLIADKTDPAFGIKDGDTFTLTDANGHTEVFEFDTDGSAPTNAVTVAAEATASAVKTAIINAINGNATLLMTATSGVDQRIELVQNTAGTLGNNAITESISNGSSLAPFGMTGGFDNTELTWTQNLRIIAPGRTYEYTISSQTISNIADGEVVYATLPTEGATPGGPLALTKVAASSYPLDHSNTRNYIIAYRSGTKVYFGNGAHGIELEDGETGQLGDGITDQWITATGLVDEFDADPPYSSGFWVTPGASFTTAISELDQIVDSIYNMVVGTPYDEFFVLPADLPSGSSVTLPAPFGLGSPQTYQTGIRQLEVFLNGAKINLGDDYAEVANIGAGVGDQIQTLYDLPKGAKLQFRIQIGGGQDGTVSTDAPDVQYEGTLVEPTAAKINFRDQCEVFESVPGTVDVRIRRGRELGRKVVNNTASPIPIYTAIAWESDGSVILADANVVSASDIVGITAEEIPASGGVGFVYREGYVPNSLIGLDGGSDPVPGRAIYLSGTPGQMTVTPPTGLLDTVIRLGLAEPPDGQVGTGTNLWLHPEVVSQP